MAESAYVHNNKDRTISLSDNGGANSYTISREVGDFSDQRPGYATEWLKDRGEHDVPRRGEAQNLTLSFTAFEKDVGNSSAATLIDICNSPWTNYVGSNWTSTLTGTSDVEATDLATVVDGTWKGEADKTLTYSDVVVRAGVSEASSGNTIPVTGEAAIHSPTLS